MPKFSKQHYELVAFVLKDERTVKITAQEQQVVDQIAKRFATEFRLDNPNFKEAKFLIAAGVPA